MLKSLVIRAFLLPLVIILIPASCLWAQDHNVIIHVRGVYETDVSILALTANGTFKPFTSLKGLKNGETATLRVPADKLPGMFVLRFDYREKQESNPYPGEKSILLNDQDIELWAHPMYSNNPDSTWFQNDERENAAWTAFSKENSNRKEKLALLQQFLMNYDDTGSGFYRQGVKEFEKRRTEYNGWLNGKAREDQALFAASLYRFQFVPEIPWEGTEKDRLISVITHYFDGVDFNDPKIIRTSQMNEWMNNYVNLHGQMATSLALRDSIIPAAAKSAIEKARQGDPAVYGWMVDYFYRGFEANNIPAGMKTLQPYLDDPACLTSKRMEIGRRIKGMETLTAGSRAPEIELKDLQGGLFTLSNYQPETDYLLLFFWSADCSHCTETVEALYPWHHTETIRKKLSVLAISLDDSETEVKAWEQKIRALEGWKHLRAPGGVNSKVAADYFVLATPVMILLNAKTKEILSLPTGFAKLREDMDNRLK